MKNKSLPTRRGYLLPRTTQKEIHCTTKTHLKSSIAGKKQSGLTLLELTVVLLILVTLATVALRSTVGLQDQSRWEQTKNRYEAIKQSIIGNPDLIINGQPDISGFVADMGRLPDNIKELLTQNYCDNDYEETVPGSCGGTWVANPVSFIDCSDGVSADEATCLGAGEIWHSVRSGWKGPYLISSENSTDEDAFVDGWANLPTAVTDLDYGWLFTPNGGPPAISLNLQSGGCVGCSLVDYTNAYPPLPLAIAQDNWNLDISPNITVLIKMPFNGTCSGATCSDPSYTDGASCASNGGAWSCEDNLSTTKAICLAVPDVWKEPGKANCEAGGQTWAPTAHTLQLIVRFKQEPGTSQILTSTNSPILNDDGQFHYVQFDFPVNTFIPLGIALIEIKEAGADFQHTGLQIPFFPNHIIPTLNW